MFKIKQFSNFKIWKEKVDEKRYYTWQEFDQDCETIIQTLYPRRAEFDGVWGPSRGGLPLAVALSHGLGLPLFLSKPFSHRTLIVDDISDTGKTLAPYEETNFIVTLFVHPQTLTPPSFHIHEKGKEWVVFPWEKGR